ncbi:hypothetical protein [Rhizobium rhizogenes]|uniref:hypothetical protein n=1 Tax=Rhizobium rhizogenes TaxID=359 RepID=UPI00226F8661|nr:hypothetical protein [Rhizobium rhizogenes]
MTINELLLAACRAHAPQFDHMDAEIQKYAIEQMRAALLASVTELVLAARSILADGFPDDPEDNDLIHALEPFEALVPYDNTIDADISAAMITTHHVNGGAYRVVSVDEWKSLGGDSNKLCDWHEGIGYVIYDDLALEQFRAKIAARKGDSQ